MHHRPAGDPAPNVEESSNTKEKENSNSKVALGEFFSSIVQGVVTVAANNPKLTSILTLAGLFGLISAVCQAVLLERLGVDAFQYFEVLEGLIAFVPVTSILSAHSTPEIWRTALLQALVVLVAVPTIAYVIHFARAHPERPARNFAYLPLDIGTAFFGKRMHARFPVWAKALSLATNAVWLPIWVFSALLIRVVGANIYVVQYLINKVCVGFRRWRQSMVRWSAHSLSIAVVVFMVTMLLAVLPVFDQALDSELGKARKLAACIDDEYVRRVIESSPSAFGDANSAASMNDSKPALEPSLRDICEEFNPDSRANRMRGLAALINRDWLSPGYRDESIEKIEKNSAKPSNYPYPVVMLKVKGHEGWMRPALVVSSSATWIFVLNGHGQVRVLERSRVEEAVYIGPDSDLVFPGSDSKTKAIAKLKSDVRKLTSAQELIGARAQRAVDVSGKFDARLGALSQKVWSIGQSVAEQRGELRQVSWRGVTHDSCATCGVQSTVVIAQTPHEVESSSRKSPQAYPWNDSGLSNAGAGVEVNWSNGVIQYAKHVRPLIEDGVCKKIANIRFAFKTADEQGFVDKLRNSRMGSLLKNSRGQQHWEVVVIGFSEGLGGVDFHQYLSAKRALEAARMLATEFSRSGFELGTVKALSAGRVVGSAPDEHQSVLALQCKRGWDEEVTPSAGSTSRLSGVTR